jgi:hypothetical protein
MENRITWRLKKMPTENQCWVSSKGPHCIFLIRLNTIALLKGGHSSTQHLGDSSQVEKGLITVRINETT